MRLYHNAVIISMDEQRRIWQKGAIAVEGNKILSVGREEDVLPLFPEAERINVHQNILLPGLINCHVHMAQAMLRGMADDLDLMPLVMGRFWPLQAQYSAKEGVISAKLCLTEMLRSGTTTFIEAMLAHNYGTDGIASAILESGMRGIISKIVMEASTHSLLPERLIQNRQESFQDAYDTYKKWNGVDERLQIWLAPRWTGSFNPSLLEEVAQYKQNHNMSITMHFAESQEDVDIIREKTGLQPVEFLNKIGVAGSKMVLIHGTYLNEHDIEVMAETNTRLAHCPLSNMKCAMNYAKVPQMLDNGVTVGLGTDGGPCNNTYDMFLEMRAAALLHKDRSQDPKVLPAEKALEMATIKAAEVLGLDKEIGSLEVGKKADFITLNMQQAHLTPSLNPVSTVVYAANGNDVDCVVIDGKEVVKHGKVLTIDEKSVLEEVRTIAPNLIKNIGLNKQSLVQWPMID
jgi:cytosine/adenosine deaminase-related metal-dependent hydrolase